MGFIKEFKEFAIKGNVIDLAVGVVIGGAFTKIVGSLVDDIITPAILTPALKAANLTDLSQLKIAGTGIKYGNFISQIISFFIVTIALFLFIKAVNSMKKKEMPAVEASVITPEETLLMEIRDLLKQQNRA